VRDCCQGVEITKSAVGALVFKLSPWGAGGGSVMQVGRVET
jgi:hypothetical protein